ncbi:MAG: NTP transferase domain-containing protein [Planctomycetes bacterium]|nr:NTP transferase domain-containing protein [Planctomycetota bacterium]
MTTAPPVAVVLAAGKGTRMKSARPKVLHEVLGRPLVEYVLDAARAAGAARVVVVVGHGADEVRDALSKHRDVSFVLQSQQLGTGHAVMVCRDELAGHTGPVLVLSGDTPLVRGETLAGLLAEQRRAGAACVIGTAVTEANRGLGRIVRDAAGHFVRIVEERDAAPEEAAIREINTGCYAFDGPALLWALERLRPENVQAEYYLTDCPAILLADGRSVVAAPLFDIREAMGVNTPEQLAEVAETMRRRAEGGAQP